MEELLSFLNQGWVGSLIGFVGVVLGVIGIYSYKISKSASEPSFQKFALRLIGREEDNLPREITVFFKGKEVDRLTKTILIIWNNGTEVLDGKDVVQTDPITIEFDSGDNVLSYNVLKRTKDVNKFEITKIEDHPHQLRANFDYLDPNDGIVLEILHDSKKKYPIIKGTMKGVPNGFVDLGIVFVNRQSKTVSKSYILRTLGRPRLVLAVLMIIGSGIAILGLLPHETRQYLFVGLHKADEISFSGRPNLLVILGLLYASLPAYLVWSRRRKYPARLEYEEFDA